MELGAVELGIAPVGGEQVAVRAALGDATGLDHQDLVGVHDRRQPVGDDDGRAALQRCGQGGLNIGLRGRVEVRGRLVEDHDPRLGEQESGDRQPLALAAREPVAALADDRPEPVGQRPDQIGKVGLVEGAPELVVRRPRPGEAQVLAHRVVEEVTVLGDHAGRLADRLEREVANIDAAEPDRARIGVVEPRDERGDRRLAAPRRSHQRDHLTRRGPERHAVEDLGAAAVIQHGDLLERRQRHLVGRRIRERHVVELDRDRAVGHHCRPRSFGDQWFEVEHLEDPFEADQRGHRVDPRAGQRRQRGVELTEQQRQRHHRPRIEPVMDGQPAAEAVDQRQRERRHERQGGHEHVLPHRRPHPDLGDPTGSGSELGLLACGAAEQLHERGARRIEPLRHLGGHRRVVIGGLPFEMGET